MKKLLVILGSLFVLFLLVLAGGYFLLTNPGFQKRMIEARLPEGSSVESVRLGPGSAELSGLDLRMPDGAVLRIARAETSYDPWAALRRKTIRMGAIEVRELELDISEVAARPAEPRPPLPERKPEAEEPEREKEAAPPVAEEGLPWELLRQVEEFEWLVDIEKVDIGGRLRDGNGNEFEFRIVSDAIRPGRESHLEADLSLVSGRELEGGFRTFASEADIRFRQKEAGGFEAFAMKTDTTGKDGEGAVLLSVRQELGFSLDSKEKRAEATASVDAELLQPGRLVPELDAVGAVRVRGEAGVRARGEALTLEKADFTARAADREIARAQLLQSMALRGEQEFEGELLQVGVNELPLVWLNPWLPPESAIEGGPLSFELAVRGEANGDLAVSGKAELPRPDLLAPELDAVGALRVRGGAVVRPGGTAVTLKEADITAYADDREFARAELRQSVTLRGERDLEGELFEARLRELPLNWVNPWLPSGFVLEGAPLSLELAVAGGPDGGWRVRAEEPITLGPVSIRRDGEPLVEELKVLVDPALRLGAEGNVEAEWAALEFADAYGQWLEGSGSARFHPAERTGGDPFSGVVLDTDLRIGLQEMFQQPALAGYVGILGGELVLAIQVDGASPEPVRASARLNGLRPRAVPEDRRDYAVGAMLAKGERADEWRLSGDFRAGPEDRPSSNGRFSGSAEPMAKPVPFQMELNAERIRQSDIGHLMAVLDVGAPDGAQTERPAPGTRRDAPTPATEPMSGATTGAEGPPWAMLDGTLRVRIDAFELNTGRSLRQLRADARVSPEELSLSSFSGRMEDAKINGSGAVRHRDDPTNAYQLDSELEFEGFDPEILSAAGAKNVPVRGTFAGSANVRSEADSLERLAENARADIRVTGRDGVLTAFELDERGQLGLAGAGLLGRAMDRPGISALAETIPYFKDMRFDEFVLELSRGENKRIDISQLLFTGENLLIDAAGSIAPGRLKEIMKQPMRLNMNLGAKGALTDHLETLGLLSGEKAEDGFRRWKKDVAITGTLADPNTDSLMQLLRDAARSALTGRSSRRGDGAEPTAEGEDGQKAAKGDGAEQNGKRDGGEDTSEKEEGERETPESESRLNDVQRGMKLFESLIGQ